MVRNPNKYPYGSKSKHVIVQMAPNPTKYVFGWLKIQMFGFFWISSQRFGTGLLWMIRNSNAFGIQIPTVDLMHQRNGLKASYRVFKSLRSPLVRTMRVKRAQLFLTWQDKTTQVLTIFTSNTAFGLKLYVEKGLRSLHHSLRFFSSFQVPRVKTPFSLFC